MPFTEIEKPEEDKWRVGTGEEEALCFGHNNFELPIRNPNGNVNFGYTSLESRGRDPDWKEKLSAIIM